ncbi:RING-H2 finger protein ATL72-like protein [Carex littledalei]|uniref:RING-H2 finger protein ATL72-like protein n=1 Tax=Carex littledalei TaxID=544730 RepID=A0A833RAT2_9POAL|nr:RING-H2 finger protein ATL72-like protein [Carex littledalei]
MEVHSRKLLSQTNINKLLTSMPPPPSLSPITQDKLNQTRSEALAQTRLGGQFSTFNADIVLILSILLCGVVCAVAVNVAVRCILRFTSQTCNHGSPDSLTNDEIQTQSSTKIKGKEALQVLPRLVYSSRLELTGSGSECTICLSEFKHGVHVRVLPVCNHGFHVRCIDRWLSTRCTCPTCRRCLVGINQQDVGQVGPTVSQVRVEPVEESMQV